MYPRASVSDRAVAYVAKLTPSVAGQGGHDDAFRAACVLLHGFGLSEHDAAGIFADHFNPRCSPPWNASEIAHKIRSAAGSPSRRGHGYLLDDSDDRAVTSYVPSRLAPMPPPEWPDPAPARIADIVKEGPDATELWQRSPEHVDDLDGAHTAAIVSAFFTDTTGDDPWICAGRTSSSFSTRRLSDWLAAGTLNTMALIVPSPMSAKTGKTTSGRTSEHSKDNTGPRRHVVVEFDQGSSDEHAALIWHLGGFAPLALVVHSGNKSLHAWFVVGDAMEDEVKRFMRYSASLGADAALFRNKSQFVRMPDGLR